MIGPNKKVVVSPRKRPKSVLLPGLWMLASLLMAGLALRGPAEMPVVRASFDASAEVGVQGGQAGLIPSSMILAAGNDVWQDFTPGSEWVSNPFVCSVTVVDPDGVKQNTAYYRKSTNGGASWTAWSDSGLTAVMGAVTTTARITVSGLEFPDSETANLIQFRIQDRDEPFNEEYSEEFHLWVDSTSPSSSINTTGYYGASPAWPGRIGGTANDGTSDVQYVDLTVRRLFPAAYWNGSFWQTPPIYLRASGAPGSWYYVFTPVDGKTYTVESLATDNAGNVQPIAASSTFTYDISSPLPPSITGAVPGAVFTSTNCFTVTWTNPLDYSGISGAYYKFNAPPASNSDYHGFRPGEGLVGLECLTVPAEGKNDIYIWLLDRAGNASYLNTDSEVDVFWFDATAPVASAGAYDRPPDHGTWYTDTVSLDLACDDGLQGSGCALIEWRLQGETAWQEGSRITVGDDSRRMYELRGTDYAHNVQAPPTVVAVPIDTHPPETTHELNTPPNSDGWHNSQVQVTLVVSDVVSGPGVSYYRVDDGPEQTGTTFTIGGEGVHKVEYRSQDSAGNLEEWHVVADIVSIDSIAPTTTSDIPGVADCDGWSAAASVTANLSAMDPVPSSGVAYTEYQLVPSGSWQRANSITEAREGAWTYNYRSVDNAGNSEAAQTIVLGLDRTAPGKPRDLLATPIGWSRVPTFTLSWVDPLSPEDVSPIDVVYYKLDVPPVGNLDGVPVPPEGNNIQVVVDSEGRHGVSIWLQDCAGNVDYRNNRQALDTFKYDASPPDTTAILTGTEGRDGWYRSAVHVTLLPLDTLSGVAQSYYRLDGGEWQTGSAFDITEDGLRHRYEYYSVDVAGNIEEVSSGWVNIDTSVPPIPVAFWSQPSTCSRVNAFSVHWDNPVDTPSGIGGAYYKLYTVPLGPLDYTGYVDHEVESITGIQVDGEGTHQVYVWLEDRAGNSDYHSYVQEEFCYDATPPLTTAGIVEGTAGEGGWYLSPVVIRLTSDDSVAGLQRIEYRIGGGSWLSTPVTSTSGTITFEVATEGAHSIEYRAMDMAGNLETARQLSVKIDLSAPYANVAAPPYSKDTAFIVRWEGKDITPGGSVSKYDVQYRRDLSGNWTAWKSGATVEQATFTVAEEGHIYYFRARATDAAGRRGEWSASDAAGTWVDSLENGDFGGGLQGWGVPTGELPVTASDSAQACGSAPELILGNPELGGQGGNIPVGAARLAKTVVLPPRNLVPNMWLSFRYRTITYDLLEWPSYPQDSFDVTVIDAQVNEHLVWRDGNTDPVYYPPPAKMFDLGCRVILIDLSGFQHDTQHRSIQIRFANWNRTDEWYNTWTYLDDVKLVVQRTVCLPLVLQGTSSVRSLGVAQEAPSELGHEGGVVSSDPNSPPSRRW